MATIRSTYLTKQSSNENYPAEIWSIIFKNLNPTFINSVLRTCHFFNTTASSDVVFTPLLESIYPSHSDKNDPLRQYYSSSYSLFKHLYTDETRTLSPRARMLLDLCSPVDHEQIALLNFSPDALLETTTKELAVITHVAHTCSQATLDVIFQKVLAWFTSNAQNTSWWANFPLSFVIDTYRTHEIFSTTTPNNCYLMDFAIGLNQIDFIKQHLSYLNTHKLSNPLHYPPTITHYFQWACRLGYLELVKFLLIRHYRFDAETYDYEDPLTYAAKGKQTEIVDFLLATHARDISSNMMICAAYTAVENDDVDTLEVILLNPNDISSYVYSGDKTLLNVACQLGKPATAKLICNMFPDLLSDGQNFTAGFYDNVYLATKAGCSELLEFFLNMIEDVPSYLASYPHLLIAAAKTDSAKTVNYLLSAGAPIDAETDKGTALHNATRKNCLSTVRVLVQHGADMTIENAQGETALEIAKSNNHEEIALFLMTSQFENNRKRKAESAPVVEGVEEPPHPRPRH